MYGDLVKWLKTALIYQFIFLILSRVSKIDIRVSQANKLSDKTDGVFVLNLLKFSLSGVGLEPTPTYVDQNALMMQANLLHLSLAP